MKHLLSRQLCVLVLAASGVFAFPDQQVAENDDSMTVTVFCARGDLDQTKIAGRLLLKGFNDLSTVVDEAGIPKSSEKLKLDRAMSDLIRSHFKEPDKQGQQHPHLEIEPDATIMIRRAANYAKSVNPGQLIWNVVVIYVKHEFEKLYTKQTEEWKSNFESWTPEQRLAHFGAGWRSELIEEFLRAAKERAAELRKEAKALEIEIVVDTLKVGSRRLKTNPSRVILLLKNDTKYAATFDLKCGASARTISVSMPANGTQEVNAAAGAGRAFGADERCEFVSAGKRLRTFFAVSDKSLAATEWMTEEEELWTFKTDTVISSDLANNVEEGTYTVRGNIVLIEFPYESYAAVIKGNEIEMTVISKKTGKTWKSTAERVK